VCSPSVYLCHPPGSHFHVRASGRSKQECQKCDDGSIGRRYRPIPQYELDISANSVAYSFGRIRIPSFRQRTVALIGTSTWSRVPSSLGAACCGRCSGEDETCRRITARGSNTYAFLAPFVCESTVHLLHGKFSRDGAHLPGAIVEAQEVLKRRRTDLGNSKLCQPDRAQL